MRETATVAPRLGDYFVQRQEPGKAGLPTLSVTLNDGLVLRNLLDRRTESALAPESHLLVRAGDVVYNTMRMWQGACGVADSDGLVSPAYVVMAPRPGIDSRFAYHWFKTARLRHLLWAYSHGITDDRLRLYADDFASIPAEPPPLNRQRTWAAALDDWDEAIKQTQSLITAKQQRLRGALQLFFQGVHEDARPLARGWRRVTIGELAAVVGGGTPDTANDLFWDGDVPWCTPTDLSNIETRFVDRTARCISNEGLRASSATILPAHSVVLCTRASVGSCAINRVPMATNQGFQSLVPKSNIDVSFLYYLVRSSARRLLRMAAGSTFLELSGRELSKIIVAAPQLEEQRRIASLLSAMDDEVDLVREGLSRLRLQKHSLMQRLPTDGPRLGAGTPGAAA